jgi:hypothetical protein
MRMACGPVAEAFDLARAEQPVGPHQQDHQHGDVGHDVAHLAAQVGSTKAFEQADDQPGDDGPGNAVEPAEDDDRQHAQGRAAERRRQAGHAGDDEAGHRADDAGEHPGQALRLAHVDAQHVGGERVAGRGAHGDAGA